MERRPSVVSFSFTVFSFINVLLLENAVFSISICADSLVLVAVVFGSTLSTSSICDSSDSKPEERGCSLDSGSIFGSHCYLIRISNGSAACIDDSRRWYMLIQSNIIFPSPSANLNLQLQIVNTVYPVEFVLVKDSASLYYPYVVEVRHQIHLSICL